MKYIDADKLKAEIERRVKELDEQIVDIYDSKAVLRKDELQKLLSFLDTLEPVTDCHTLEEPEKPINPADAMKELEEKIALVKQRGTWDGVDVDKYMDEVRGRELEKPVQNDLEEAAKAYFENPENSWQVKDVFTAGAKWDRQQMLKEAVEGEITKDNRGNNALRVGVLNNGFEIGDKVRIIIVKED